VQNFGFKASTEDNACDIWSRNDLLWNRKAHYCHHKIPPLNPLRCLCSL